MCPELEAPCSVTPAAARPLRQNLLEALEPVSARDPRIPRETARDLAAVRQDAGRSPAGMLLESLLPSATTRPTAGADGRYTPDEGFETLAVVGVGGGDADGEGQTGPLCDQVDIRALLAAIDRIRSCQLPPH